MIAINLENIVPTIFFSMEILPHEVDSFKSQLKREFNSVPVLLDNKLAEEYYNGFCNSIIWPLFHCDPGDTFKKQLSNKKLWAGYQEVNRRFARTIVPYIEDNDVVWVQDFHLMLLPQMLREELSNKQRCVNLKIGSFVHIPFPSSDIYRILPVRQEILQGILHSDLIGFHTDDYTRHFLDSCSRILRLHPIGNSNYIKLHNRLVSVGTFPIGIDPDRHIEGLQKLNVRERLASLERKFRGVKVIIGVERLDYIKGVPQKLHALKLFLTEHREWIGKVTLVQIAVPSRLYIQEYRDLRSEVEELVSNINGEFGSIDFTPVYYLHKTVPFDELLALFAVSDVCLVSSVRDGMNLVSSEYVASQAERKGSLIISEFAGAAQSLKGSIVANPWNTEELANAIHQAVTMSSEQREINWKQMEEHVKRNTSTRWGETFVRELSKTRVRRED